MAENENVQDQIDRLTLEAAERQQQVKALTEQRDKALADEVSEKLKEANSLEEINKIMDDAGLSRSYT